MNKHTPPPFLLAACSAPVDGAAQRIQLIPAGEFRANDGRPADAPFWRLSPQRAAALVAELNARPVRLMVDYEHQTLFTAQNGQPNPASGWLSGFEWVDGKGLYAEVQWTAAAKQRIAGGEYAGQSARAAARIRHHRHRRDAYRRHRHQLGQHRGRQNLAGARRARRKTHQLPRFLRNRSGAAVRPSERGIFR